MVWYLQVLAESQGQRDPDEEDEMTRKMEIRSQADKVVAVTEAEAKALPGLLGRTVWAALYMGCGYRHVTVDGVKVFYERKEV